MQLTKSFHPADYQSGGLVLEVWSGTGCGVGGSYWQVLSALSGFVRTDEDLTFTRGFEARHFGVWNFLSTASETEASIMPLKLCLSGL